MHIYHVIDKIEEISHPYKNFTDSNVYDFWAGSNWHAKGSSYSEDVRVITADDDHTTLEWIISKDPLSDEELKKIKEKVTLQLQEVFA